MGEASEGPLVRIAMLWNRRKARADAGVVSAREKVAHLSPAVVVTGGSRGIGAALAQRFAADGHRVAIVSRDACALEAAAAAIKAQSPSPVLIIACDVTTPDAYDRIERALTNAGLYCDTLVNNAAIGLSGPFTGQDEAALGDLIALNVTALTRLCRRTLPDMLSRQQGGILNVASLGGYAPGPHQAAYYASKAYVLSLTEALAAETSGFGVRIAVVAPGPVNTPFHDGMGSESAYYRHLLPALSAARVAAIACSRYRLGQRVIIPGLFNRGLSICLKLLPHPLSVPLVAWLLKNRDE